MEGWTLGRERPYAQWQSGEGTVEWPGIYETPSYSVMIGHDKVPSILSRHGHAP